MTEDDLDLIYVLIDVEGRQDRQPKSVRDLSDKEFRNWIVPFANYHGVQVLPSLGRIGMETRLAMINYLIRNGVRIYKQARPPRT
ncbi:hypothetical protein BH23CHL2_BH23CHL2_00400 [soil metagenome]